MTWRIGQWRVHICIFNKHNWNYSLLYSHFSAHKLTIACVCRTTVPCFPTLRSACVNLKSSGRKKPPIPTPYSKEVSAHPIDVMLFSQRKESEISSVVGQTPVYGKWALSELMRKVCRGGGWKVIYPCLQAWAAVNIKQVWQQLSEGIRGKTLSLWNSLDALT